jgi:CRP-like cAMP-binding protein
MFHRKSDRLDRLAKVPLFKGLSKRELRLIDQRADEVHVKAGRTLAKQGERGREFLLILEGQARVERDGKVIARLKDGDVFGEMALIDNEPRSASVIADGPMALMVVSRPMFGDMLESSPSLQRKVRASLSARLREADRKLSSRN